MSKSGLAEVMGNLLMCKENGIIPILSFGIEA